MLWDDVFPGSWRLVELATEFEGDIGIACSFAVSGDEHDIGSDGSLTFYRVAQEAVRNAVRHASAHRIRIVLFADEQGSRLEIHDDGRGFDLQVARRDRVGIGLLSMGERMSLANGLLEINTAPGSGTTIVASVPLSAAHDASY